MSDSSREFSVVAGWHEQTPRLQDPELVRLQQAAVRWSGYHGESRVETEMHCGKLSGQRLMARDFNRQVAGFKSVWPS